jgi:hypothetical protein
MASTNARDLKKGDSLQGFLTLKPPTDMCLYDCTYHRRAVGTRWIGLPDGKGKDGKTNWGRLIDFAAKTLAATEELLRRTS